MKVEVSYTKDFRVFISFLVMVRLKMSSSQIRTMLIVPLKHVGSFTRTSRVLSLVTLAILQGVLRAQLTFILSWTLCPPKLGLGAKMGGGASPRLLSSYRTCKSIRQDCGERLARAKEKTQNQKWADPESQAEMIKPIVQDAQTVIRIISITLPPAIFRLFVLKVATSCVSNISDYLSGPGL
jgi:hypothetical protein